MATSQIPSNLIHQLQILLNKQAQFPSFNPNDPSLPSPPTIQDALTSIDQSPDLLRCKHCNGGLLRGADSIICIYCGNDSNQDSVPQDISFKSTVGFGWLIESLGLDASESVGLPVGHSQSYKGQASIKNDILLSDLLDLELKCTGDVKRESVKNEAELPGKRYLNLVGVDYGDIFTEGSKEHASHIYNEQTVVSKNSNDKHNGLSFFNNTESGEVALGSDDSELNESSAWEAEFQSAIPGTKHMHMQSSDVSQLSAVNFESHIDSEIGPKPDKSTETSVSHASSVINLNRDLNSDVGHEGEVAGKVFGSVDVSSFDWPLEDLQKSTSAHLPDGKKIDGDDLTDTWKKSEVVSGSESNTIEPSYINSKDGQDIPDDAWNAFTGSAGVRQNQVKTGDFEAPSDNSLSSWNNFASATKAGAIQLETRSTDTRHGIVDSVLGENDFAQDQLQAPVESSPKKIFDQPDQVDFLSSHSSSTAQNDQLQSKETKSPAGGIMEETDDSLDIWDDFKSSGIEGQQTVNDVKVADNKLPGLDNGAIDAWSCITNSGAKNIEQETNEKLVVDNSHDGLSSWNDVSATVTSDTLPGVWGGFSSSAVSQNGLHQGKGTQMSENQSALGDDGFVNSWSDFRGSGTGVDNSYPSSDFQKSNQDEISVKKPPEYNNLLNSWGDFGLPTSMSKTQSQSSGAESFANKLTVDNDDLFSEWSQSEKKCTIPPDNQLNSVGVTVDDRKLLSVNADAFDALTNLTSSSNVQTNNLVSNPESAPDTKDVVKQDDPFDNWNVFVTSPELEASNNAALTQADEKNSCTSTNSQGVDSDSSMKPDLFLGVFNDQSSSQVAAAPSSDIPDLFRREEGTKPKSSPELMDQSEEASLKTSGKKSSDAAKTLISEMHDLSFMLDTNLCIPKTTE